MRTRILETQAIAEKRKQIKALGSRGEGREKRKGRRDKRITLRKETHI